MVGRQLRAVHVGRGEIVWQDRCDAANGSKEPILPNAAPHTFRSDELNAGISDGKDGPERPSIHQADAAPQLDQTGHSSTLRHFRRVKVGWAGLSCHWLRSEDLESNLRQNGSPGGLWRYYVPIISAAVRCYSLVSSSIISE